MGHTPDNERLVLLAFLSLSPLERGGFLLLFNSEANAYERRRCDISIAPGGTRGWMAISVQNPEAMGVISAWMAVEGLVNGLLVESLNR